MLSKTSFVTFIPARNEEKQLSHTLKALCKQTILPTEIIVVNDGSNDRTSEIAKEFDCHVIDLPDRGYSVLGMPDLAQVHNHALKKCEKLKPDYVMVLGADHILSSTYVEQLIERMKHNPNIALASGSILDEPCVETHPRGSGRIMLAKFLDKMNWRYPLIFGWESYFVYKAMQLGYATKQFNDILSHVLRKTFVSGGSGRKNIYYGQAMRTLGYFWLYFLARTFLLFLRSPHSAIYMFYGFCIEKQEVDIAPFVNEWQRKRFWKHLVMRLKRKVHW